MRVERGITLEDYDCTCSVDKVYAVDLFTSFVAVIIISSSYRTTTATLTIT